MIRPATVADMLSLIRCGAQDQSYVLEMTRVHGIHRSDRMRRIATPDDRAGQLATKEGPVDVFPLTTCLGCPAPPSRAVQHVLVLNTAAGRWGLLVDRVSQVMEVASRQVTPLPAIFTETLTGFFQGVLQLGPELLLLLAPDRLHPTAATSALPASATSRFPTAAARPRPAAAPRPLPQGQAGRMVQFFLTDHRAGQRPLSFGLSITQVQEILEPLPLLPVPSAPGFVLGLVSWRDRPVPVIDLAARLGLPALAADRQTRLMIVRVRAADDLIGLLVRPQAHVLTLPLPHWKCERPLPLDRSLTRGIVELRKQTLVIPDLEKLLQSRS